MTTRILTPDDSPGNEPPDFSLVLGGPLYQIWRRSRLAGSTLQLLHRRLVVMTLLAWAPLLALSIAEGYAWGGGVSLPFINDIEMHLRLLVAMPLLICAELYVHRRMRSVVAQFLSRELIPDTARAQFSAAVASAMKMRNSIPAELALLALVYGVGVLFLWRTRVVLDVSSWYEATVNGQLQPTLAGWWLGCVSLPLFQFLLLRWYYRLFIWARFLWQVSRIELSVMPAHPDRCGGLGFLSGVSMAFAPILLAQGVLLTGLMANRIFYAGATLLQFKLELIGLVTVMVFAILGPLLVFSPKLAAAKRECSREFGILVQSYVREFDEKWLRGGAPAGESFMGSADIQSLADLGNSFTVVREMRWVPFSTSTVLQLAVITLLPAVPLLLTMIPLEDLVERLLKIVF